MKAAVYNAIITEEEGGYVALNPEYDIASQGDTIESALGNLREAMELYLEEVSTHEKTVLHPTFLTTFSLLPHANKR